MGSNRLAELRSRRAAVDIDGPQFCLLLRSAVYHQVDTAYWAHQIAEDEPARSLLAALNGGKAGPGDHDAATALGAAALGLGDFSSQPLARAATGDDDGCTRHAASLALAALGMDTIQASLTTMADASPPRHGWRRAQALAQMKAAGFSLPQASFGLQMLVVIWSIGLRVWDNRWRIATESAVAGLAAGIGLGLALFANTFLPSIIPWWVLLLRSLILIPVGVALGVTTVVGAWVFRLAAAHDRPRFRSVNQVIGLWVGFVAGLLILWYPVDELTSRLAQSVIVGSEANSFTLIIEYIMSGSLWGLGMAIGYELLAGLRPGKLWPRQMLGAGTGGAIGCLLAWHWIEVVPLVEPSGYFSNLEVALAGFGFGAGLALGRTAGAWLWLRLKLGSSGTVMARDG